MRTSITLWLVVAATVVGGLFGSLLDRALVARCLAAPGCASVGRLQSPRRPRSRRYRLPRRRNPEVGIDLRRCGVAPSGSQRTAQGRTPHLPSRTVFDRRHHRHNHRRPHHAERRFSRKRPRALQSAFDRFTVWGIYIRGVFFALSFLCTVWALIRTSRNASSASPGAINQGPSSAVPS